MNVPLIVPEHNAVSFRAVLERYSANIALVDEQGGTTTYEALLLAADNFVERIGGGRQLIFLQTKNTVRSISAYVGCRIAGHPVYLFQDQDEKVLQSLIDRYGPNLVVTDSGEAIEIDRKHDRAIAIHPDLRVLLSTSGSTGSPKFVKLSERNISSNAWSIAEYLHINASDRAVTSLKFNYSYGMSVVNSHLTKGASLLLSDRSVGDPKFWEVFRTFGATSFAGVPHTFETLARVEHYLEHSPGLRYATQAGGRLAPDLVRHFAKVSREAGWRFYVMYGQTEAAPRIAYLPPEMSEAFPEAIGKAIPGGTIEILDEAGIAITEPDKAGELAYSGPNVMMGYAERPEALATDQTPLRLLTGDLAQWNAAGLVQIVGRAGRFVKPYGLRVNLDDVEAAARHRALSAVCTGTDDAIIIALQPADTANSEALVAELSHAYQLPTFMFRILEMAEIPRLANGKIAYPQIIEAAGSAEASKAEKELVRAPRTGIEFVLARNQVITLLISGLWHGPAWTFISWGAFHGSMLVAQRQISRRLQSLYERSRLLHMISSPLQIAAVFVLVAVSRILFRADDLYDAIQVFRKILFGPYNWKGLDSKATLAFSFMIIAGVMVVEAMVEYGVWRRHVARRRIIRTSIALLALLMTLVLGDFTGGRFIYVRF
jgi:acyl-coenzyme A synthetase/AMP-(fatty) acid ligase